MKTFEQIQYAAIVEYSSPLTEGETITGVFYKKSWELMYYLNGNRHTIKVTPSQLCVVVKDCLTAILEDYLYEHADLRTQEEKQQY